MSHLPPGYGPAAVNTPEARFSCECGAAFRWEPDWTYCETCCEKLCPECRLKCEGCGKRLCEKHTVTVDDLTLCRKCGDEHKIDVQENHE